MFRLPKECITGHVEGWTLVYRSVQLCLLVDHIVIACSLRVFSGRPDPEDADSHESSQKDPRDWDVHWLRSPVHG